MVYPIGEAPPPNLRQPLRVELFFLTHSETGEPLAHAGALAVALAGAVIIDHLLRPLWRQTPDHQIQPFERLRVVGPQVIVLNPDVSGDPVADWAITALGGARVRSVSERQRSTAMREAIRTLAVHAYERTTAGLYAGDLAREVIKRGLGRARRLYPPTDPGNIARVRGRLCSVLTGYIHPDPQTDALGGLIRALDLTSVLYLDRPDLRDLLARMTARVEEHDPAVHQILTATDDLIAGTAVPVYG
ncbi:GPP34 family phosphoprotein [Dactylosporangium aurantiacum]|uniref:GPP34 family phosphoprotein n=1 Tax=Dactylosporangium aurantiacum TaxID=35754 RepID=A0A9Q9INK1_9ACTN|nr:GPP34 family phosphoprotein [Dactylosporangium aurantiacum]MDG6107615.1 GPP34 family phosphoprotein [Dactylosporangium aurantiacum]UWZ58786.1 GPP34 family phosphoprotein [Dactylosporangium aurantiacum]